MIADPIVLCPVDPAATPAATQYYGFIIILRHSRTEDEASFLITTLTDSFDPVLKEIQRQRDIRKLYGYEIIDSLPLQDPF